MTDSHSTMPLHSNLNASDINATVWSLTGRAAAGESVIRELLPEGIVTLGRDSNNRICLHNKTVSSNHAELEPTAESLLVRDLDSTNGTYINGERISGTVQVYPGDVVQFGSAIFHVESGSGDNNTATEMSDVLGESMGRLHFSKLLNPPAVVPYYQPIIQLHDGKRIGFEALARSQLLGLEMPKSMFEVAAERNAEIELSALIRHEALRISSELPLDEHIFLNTHPLELNHAGFCRSLRKLREQFPDQSIMLEIHEGAVTDLQLLRRIRELLLELGIGLSYDDFGAGQSRLLELVEVPPDVLKFDFHLINGLHLASPERRRLIEGLVKITKELGIQALAECVELDEELEACREVGFDLAQGFIIGRPAPIRTWIV